MSRHCVLFFFSSRRRHTRWPRDWSSDVCSSDLGEGGRRGLGLLRLLDLLPLRAQALDVAGQLLLAGSFGGRAHDHAGILGEDRKSTRLNSSHVAISYAVFCLKKKTKIYMNH